MTLLTRLRYFFHQRAKCPFCGRAAQRKAERCKVNLSPSVSAWLDNIEFWSCPRCDESFVDDRQSRAIDKRRQLALTRIPKCLESTGVIVDKEKKWETF